MSAIYDKWNEALCRFFFGPANSSKVTYLYVTESVLQELVRSIGEKECDALNSFCNAVISSASDIDHLFRTAHSRAKSWAERGMKGFPPFIAVLALCVLAATKMEADPDEGIGGGNYYYRLRELLGLGGRGKPEGFEKTVELWDYLRQWQENNGGCFGRTNVFRFGSKYTGLPRSQCLIREAEKEELSAFFSWSSYEPGQRIDDKEFANKLEAYLSSRINRLQRLFFSGRRAVREAIVQAALVEFDAWTGDPLLAKARQRRFSLLLEFNGFLEKSAKLRLIAACDEGKHGTPPEGYNWSNGYYWRWLDDHDDLLCDSTLELSEGRKITYHAAPIHVFRRASELGFTGWISQKHFVLGQYHWILYHDSCRDIVEEWLSSNGLVQLELFNPHLAQWAAVLVSIPEDKTDLSSLSCGGASWHLLDNSQILTSGGMHLGGNKWHVQDPPVVLISAPSKSTLSINGTPRLSLVHGDDRLSLADLVDSPGTYELSVRRTTKRISLEQGEIIKITGFEPTMYPVSNGLVEVSGAYMNPDPSTLPSPIVIREKTVLYNDRGRVLQRSLPRKTVFPALRDLGHIGVKLAPALEPSWGPIDYFVEYLTTRKSGSKELFLKGLKDRLASQGNSAITTFRLRKCLHQLGIVEISNSDRNGGFSWSVAPPSAAVIPCSEPAAVIYGARTLMMIEQWTRSLIKGVSLLCSPSADEWVPHTFYLVAEDKETLHSFLRKVGIRFNEGAKYFAFDFARCVPTITEIVSQAETAEEPKRYVSLEFWNSTRASWVTSERTRLRRYVDRFQGRTHLLEVENKKLISVAPDVGKLFIAGEEGARILNHREFEFRIKKSYYLPDNYDRLLVSCSGVPPIEEKQVRVYQNVPLELAMVVAHKLGLELSTF